MNEQSKYAQMSSLDILTITFFALRFLYLIRVPFLNNSSVYYLLYYGMSIFLLYNYYKYIKNHDKNILPSYVWCFILFIGMYTLKILLSKRWGIDFYSPANLLSNYYNLFVSLYIGEYLLLRGREKQNNWQYFNFFIFFFVFLTAAYSYIYLWRIDPLASRKGNSLYKGVADFNFLYAFIFVPVFPYFREIKNKFLQILFWLFGLAFLVKTGFMIAVLMYIYITVLKVIFRNTFSWKKLVAIHIFIFIMAVISREIIGHIFLYVADIFEKNWVIQNKLLAIGNFLLGVEGEMDTLLDRVYLSSISWKTFKQNWLFGIPFSKYGEATIGSHAQWFDDLARMGLLSGVYILFLWKYYISFVQVSSGEAKIAFWVYIILGFLNPNIMPTTSLILFGYIFPVYLKRSYVQKGINYETEN